MLGIARHYQTALLYLLPDCLHDLDPYIYTEDEEGRDRALPKNIPRFKLDATQRAIACYSRPLGGADRGLPPKTSQRAQLACCTACTAALPQCRIHRRPRDTCLPYVALTNHILPSPTTTPSAHTCPHLWHLPRFPMFLRVPTLHPPQQLDAHRSQIALSVAAVAAAAGDSCLSPVLRFTA